LDYFPDCLVDMLQLCDEFSPESHVAFADQGDLAPKVLIGGAESHQLALLSTGVATEFMSFCDKALEGVRCSEGQAFDVPVGVQLADLGVRGVCRVAHGPMLPMAA
jgi:hypothetical protein